MARPMVADNVSTHTLHASRVAHSRRRGPERALLTGAAVGLALGTLGLPWVEAAFGQAGLRVALVWDMVNVVAGVLPVSYILCGAACAWPCVLSPALPVTMSSQTCPCRCSSRTMQAVSMQVTWHGRQAVWRCHTCGCLSRSASCRCMQCLGCRTWRWRRAGPPRRRSTSMRMGGPTVGSGAAPRSRAWGCMHIPGEAGVELCLRMQLAGTLLIPHCLPGSPDRGRQRPGYS